MCVTLYMHVVSNPHMASKACVSWYVPSVLLSGLAETEPRGEEKRRRGGGEERRGEERRRDVWHMGLCEID